MPLRHRKITYKRHVVTSLTPCRECGTPTPSKSSFVVCAECKIILRRISRASEHHVLRGVHYFVVYDPLPYPDGYKPGAMFSVTEMYCMQQANNQSLTPGMILKKGESYFQVQQPPNNIGKQKLIQIDEPIEKYYNH